MVQLIKWITNVIDLFGVNTGSRGMEYLVIPYFHVRNEPYRGSKNRYLARRIPRMKVWR